MRDCVTSDSATRYVARCECQSFRRTRRSGKNEDRLRNEQCRRQTGCRYGKHLPSRSHSEQQRSSSSSQQQKWKQVNSARTLSRETPSQCTVIINCRLRCLDVTVDLDCTESDGPRSTNNEDKFVCRPIIVRPDCISLSCTTNERAS